ncbi:MAG: hypothetical protein RL150_291 [Candidatus Parcubacteria bacterium]|jgi:glucose-6-phosphate 1-dehydrogenase
MEQQPVTIIIFGGTGDLAELKLLPALADMALRDCLPRDVRIVGFSRKPLSDAEYQAFIERSVAAKDIQAPASFIASGAYFQGDLTNKASYDELAAYLHQLDTDRGGCSSKLFYLAVPPALYDDVFTNIAAAGLTMPCREHGDSQAWTRVLVEKPFGDDAEHAAYLDARLGTLFHEDQVFRIDHYLAKETLQNILAFRFKNALFEPLWNSEHIEHVHIALYESFGIKKRAHFYDGLGALRDVGQNHILQMLALIAMEDPLVMDAQTVRAARAAALEHAVLEGSLDTSVIRGQYAGYRDEPGVDAESVTETFFRINVAIQTPRWKGTTFTLESGKALAETAARITVTFRPRPGAPDLRNVITFMVQPNEGISISFFVKRPGFASEVETRQLSFAYPLEVERLPDAYERVLFDALRGDQTLFISTAEVHAQWALIMPILAQWHMLPLITYEQGVQAGTINGSM